MDTTMNDPRLSKMTVRALKATPSTAGLAGSVPDRFGCHVFALAGPGRVDRAAVLRLVSGAVPEHTAYSMAEAVRWLACRVWREATTGDPDIHAHRYAVEQHHIDTATTVLASGEAAWVQVTTTLFTITPHPTPDRPETPEHREAPGRQALRVPVEVGS